ncbi:MATE family efflux transporter [Lachnospiraceae bacterium C1.1]|nr:MATE family efflux transporter [Lachnospiraceae bacterium C1.1]
MLRELREKFIGDRDFYRRYIYLAVPMIIQNAITNFVSFLDNIMVGQLGEEAISAVATVNQLVFIFYLSVFGVAAAGGIYGAQFYGKKDHTGHMYSFRFKLYAVIIVAIIGISLFLNFGENFISLFLTETDGNISKALATDYGLKYLNIILIGLLPFAINQAYSTTIKETGKTVIPMLSGMAAVATNAILDYCLIFGPGPLPELGVEGAAIATVVSRYIELAIVIIWAHSHKNENKYLKNAFAKFGLPRNIVIKILQSGTPLMINEVLWAAGVSAVTQSYSVRGMNVLTSISISNTVSNLFNIVFIQLGACIGIIVGQYLGAGKLKEAKDADNKMIVFSVGCCMVMAAVMMLCGRLFPMLYNVNEDIRALATKFIMIQALWMPFCSFSHCSYFTLRSGGKTFVTFLFDSVFTWVVMASFAYILTHYSGLNIVLIYFLVQGTEIIKCTIGFFMVKSNVWLVQIV